jgi:4'-phosphopantetheinyl transferase
MATQEVGVDVEGLRSLPNPDRLARRICTPDELEQLATISGDEFDARLLRLWTFKEAALKAVGLGLPGGLRNVEVDFRPGRPPRLVRLCDDSGGWSLLTADVNDSILCSIVVRGSVRRLGIRELPLQSV